MKRAVREFAVGITLALTLGGVATALLSDNFDQKPRFDTSETTDASSGVGLSTDVGTIGVAAVGWSTSVESPTPDDASVVSDVSKRGF